jgi:hypothetical protein
MNAPTIIVTACVAADVRDEAWPLFDRSLALAQTLGACGLPILVVTDQEPTALGALPAGPVLHHLSPAAMHVLDRHIEALIEGVLLTSRSPGWIWVPADTPMLSPKTVLAVANALRASPLVHAEHAQQEGIPLGVGSEFFSELIQLTGHRDMARFRTRYPALAVSVSDVGVAMSESGSLNAATPPLWPGLPHLTPGAH